MYPEFDNKMKADDDDFRKMREIMLEEVNEKLEKGELNDDVAKNRRAEFHRHLFRYLISLWSRKDYLSEGEIEE
jgi:hypothetical protein